MSLKERSGRRPTAILVAYDGSDFGGWQLQPSVPTVQGELERVLSVVHACGPERVRVVGSGRTDTGVHAIGQVATYYPPNPRDPREVLNALNARLPSSVRVLDLAVMPAAFHPCRSALGKIYRYRIINRRLVLPFETRWAWSLWRELDLEAMRVAAARLTGRHDFASFTKTGGKSVTTIRTIRRFTVGRSDDGVLEFEVEADGFLYRMVRNLVGFLVDVGRSHRCVEEIPAILASRDRAQAGVAAPAEGLCLVQVLYPPELKPWIPSITRATQSASKGF